MLTTMVPKRRPRIGRSMALMAGKLNNIFGAEPLFGTLHFQYLQHEQNKHNTRHITRTSRNLSTIAIQPTNIDKDTHYSIFDEPTIATSASMQHLFFMR